MRRLAIAFGILLVPLAVIGALLLLAPSSSWSSRAYGLGIVLATVGLLTVSRPRLRGVAHSGAVIFLAVLCLRSCTGAQGETVTMPRSDGSSARILGRLFDEGDMAFWGARAAFAAGMFRDPDAPGVPDALRAAYAEIRGREGDFPSPVVPTYLELQGPGRSDVLVVDGTPSPRGAFVFLHGFGGGFTLPCWQLAQAASAAGFVTYCPSLGPRADWWNPHGEQIVRETVQMVRARGIDKIVLAGLSNGAVGAARLAPRMPGVFRGLVLASGADVDAAPPALPVLVLQGRHDAMMPASLARAYASAHLGTYVELDAGHFALLVRRAEASRALTAWLAQR